MQATILCQSDNSNPYLSHLSYLTPTIKRACARAYLFLNRAFPIIDYDDLVQEAYKLLIESMGKEDKENREITKPMAYSMVRNHLSFNFPRSHSPISYSKNAFLQGIKESFFGNMAQSSYDPIDLEEVESYSDFHTEYAYEDFVKSLTDGESLIFFYLLQGQSVKEIHLLTGLSESHVYRVISELKAKLKGYLYD